MRRSDGPEAPPVPATRGRPFAKGNSGRKAGSKNRTTVVASALLEGEAEELLRTAITRAKAGDVVMLKFLLGRILPKERPVRVDLPSTDGDFDAVDAMGAILVAAVSGQIPPSEASALANIATAYARTLELAEVRLRLETIEENLGNLKDHLGKP
jgi:hypothetical protein